MSELQKTRKALVKAIARSKPEHRPMGDVEKRKLAGVVDPSMRAYLTQLWNYIKPEHLMLQLADLDRQIADEQDDERNRRMYSKAQAGDYGPAVKELANKTAMPGPSDSKGWATVCKLFGEDRTDQL